MQIKSNRWEREKEREKRDFLNIKVHAHLPRSVPVKGEHHRTQPCADDGEDGGKVDELLSH